MITAAPRRKAAPATARPIRSLGTIGPPPATKAPSRATPITPPLLPVGDQTRRRSSRVEAGGAGHRLPPGDLVADRREMSSDPVDGVAAEGKTQRRVLSGQRGEDGCG